ncbi:MAG: hypothetical protein ACI9F9_002200, partial [Candidatus Paceibacteria bacterium]
MGSKYFLVLALACVSTNALAQVTEQARVRSLDPSPGKGSGAAVAISGERALLGAPLDDHSGVVTAGSAYVYLRSGTTWSQEAKLIAGDAADPEVAGAYFGSAVAIAGDTAVVGAYRDDHSGLVDAGAIYVFERTGTAWSQSVKLTASDANGLDQLGHSVAISGDTLVVGARRGASSGAGAVYVFVRSGSGWSEEAKLLASDAAASDRFGWSVAVFGDTLVAGADRDDFAGFNDPGSAYVFIRAAGLWTEQAKLIASDAAAGDHFGSSVSLWQDTVLVGADDENDGTTVNAGAAYVFERSGVQWTESDKWIGSTIGTSDRFGRSVSLVGDVAVVGADRDGHSSVGDAGSAFVFQRSGSTWSQQYLLRQSEAGQIDHFGAAVAFDGQTIVVGTPGDDVACQQDEGSGYVFVLDGSGAINSYCFCECSAPCGNFDASAGCANS